LSNRLRSCRHRSSPAPSGSERPTKTKLLASARVSGTEHGGYFCFWLINGFENLSIENLMKIDNCKLKIKF